VFNRTRSENWWILINRSNSSRKISWYSPINSSLLTEGKRKRRKIKMIMMI